MIRLENHVVLNQRVFDHIKPRPVGAVFAERLGLVFGVENELPVMNEPAPVFLEVDGAVDAAEEAVVDDDVAVFFAADEDLFDLVRVAADDVVVGVPGKDFDVEHGVLVVLERVVVVDGVGFEVVAEGADDVAVPEVDEVVVLELHLLQELDERPEAAAEVLDVVLQLVRRKLYLEVTPHEALLVAVAVLGLDQEVDAAVQVVVLRQNEAEVNDPVLLVPKRVRNHPKRTDFYYEILRNRQTVQNLQVQYRSRFAHVFDFFQVVRVLG